MYSCCDTKGAATICSSKRNPGRQFVGTNVIGAVSHLQLARALRMSGNGAAALKLYEDFLSIWKNADADIPIYQQAKAEYARLSPLHKKRARNRAGVAT